MSTEYRKAQEQINRAVRESFAAASDDEMKAWQDSVTFQADAGAAEQDDAAFDSAWNGYLERVEKTQERTRK